MMYQFVMPRHSLISHRLMRPPVVVLVPLHDRAVERLLLVGTKVPHLATTSRHPLHHRVVSRPAGQVLADRPQVAAPAMDVSVSFAVFLIISHHIVSNVFSETSLVLATLVTTTSVKLPWLLMVLLEFLRAFILH
jgi:hypothetical protein